jgi:hypothetical protein
MGQTRDGIQCHTCIKKSQALNLMIKKTKRESQMFFNDLHQTICQDMTQQPLWNCRFVSGPSEAEIRRAA